MQEEEEEEIRRVRTLLAEFYNSATSNEQRKVIESQLIAWRAEESSWVYCTILLFKPNNQEYVTMFCLNTFEEIIKTKWISLEWTKSREIKHTLLQYSKKCDLPIGVLTKTVYLVVFINKLDWPRINDGIFHHVYEMLQSSTWHLVNLGILYVQTLSEVVTAPCSDISVVLYQEQQRVFADHIRYMIRKIFELMLNKRANECVALRAFSHIFTWVPIEMIPAPLLVELFRIAVDLEDKEKALMALTAINEVLVRHCASPWWEWPEFSKFVGSLLAHPPPDKRFMDKTCDFLNLVFTACLSRNLIANSFLSITIEWTDRQTTLYPGLTSVMYVWNHVIEHPSAKDYGEKLVFLANLLLRKILWTQNSNFTVEEDGEDIFNEGDDDESAWQRALRPCLEVIAKIGELHPDPVVGVVVSQWVQLCERAIQDNAQTEYLELLLRDVGSLTRTIGRLSPVWGETDTGDFVRAVTAQLLAIIRLHYHSASESIQNSLISTRCEALAALKACSHWLTRLPESELYNCTLQIMSLVVQLLDEGTPQKLQHSAAHLLASFTASVRLPNAWELPAFKSLFDMSFCHLQKEDVYLVTGGLLNSLILPIRRNEADDARFELAARFIERITQPLHDESPQAALNQVEILHLLEYLVRLYESEGSKQKKILCSILQNSAERALILYRNSLDNIVLTHEILQFFQTLLECLQTQVGVNFVQGVVNTFLNLFSAERLETALGTENGNGLQQLLAILDLVIRTPALAAAGLTPLTIALCLQLAEPIFKDSVSLMVQESYFCLVYSILEHKWQYLVKGSLDSDQRMEEFLGLLKTMGRALFFRDINLFRLNLAHFEKLNQRWRLYRTNIFKKELLFEMISVLLNTLMGRNQSLVADDIALCLCHLITADTEGFFAHYLPKFMASHDLDEYQQEQFLSNFSREMDVPSLTKNIFRFVNDITVYLPV